MAAKEQVKKLLLGLHEIEHYLEAFDDYVRNSERKGMIYINGIVSMVAIQSAKIEKLIEIAEKLENKLN